MGQKTGFINCKSVDGENSLRKFFEDGKNVSERIKCNIFNVFLELVYYNEVLSRYLIHIFYKCE